jgi:L-alanine-DL-glutamate epimerase-like enolase superfamily enzyme
VVADESCKNPGDALHLLRKAPNCKIYNIKINKTGGLLSARQLAEMAGYGGVNLMWGCNDESAVSITAALHLALSFGHTKYLDLDGSLDLVRDRVTGGFQIRDGMISTVEGPGLGLKINPD